MRTLVQDGLAQMRGGTWGTVPAKFKTVMRAMKIIGSQVSWPIFRKFVHDELAQMRGGTWRAVPAKFKTVMCEMKILGS